MFKYKLILLLVVDLKQHKLFIFILLVLDFISLNSPGGGASARDVKIWRKLPLHTAYRN